MQFIQNFSLLSELVKRDIKQRYKQSILSYAWIIINPVSQLLVIIFIFSYVIKQNNLELPYPIFVFWGLIPWTFFTNSLITSANCLVDNVSLIKKVYFPREILIFSTIISKLVDFLAAFLFILFLGIFFSYKLHLSMILFFPILAIQLIFTLGLTFLLAPLNLFFRDIQYILRLILNILVYLTPIIYDPKLLPQNFQFIFKLNPLAIIINNYRILATGSWQIDFYSLTIIFFSSLIFTIISYYFFKNSEGIFTDAA